MNKQSAFQNFQTLSDIWCSQTLVPDLTRELEALERDLKITQDKIRNVKDKQSSVPLVIQFCGMIFEKCLEKVNEIQQNPEAQGSQKIAIHYIPEDDKVPSTLLKKGGGPDGNACDSCDPIHKFITNRLDHIALHFVGSHGIDCSIKITDANHRGHQVWLTINM